ncbi:hypothetical protein [Desulfogranum marinum]|uniref:hypothetical protein n=1 Tax=Desulfogranum marinum TaxID=453220 RepID=UPI0029C99D20|nr:hypothetical protein [Desulfogranum marinum]
MDGTTNYDINFFKPRTAFLKENVRIITIGITIWAVCVFGFHIFMKVIEKRTPEPGYLIYEQVYPKLTDGTATAEDKLNIARVYLGLIGKSIDLQKNDALKGAFTATVYDVLPSAEKEAFKAATLTKTNKGVTGVANVAKLLGIEDDIVLKGVVPFALVAMEGAVPPMTAPEIPAIMEKYLIHFQSFLTDTKLFGFPFHYFYSAIFLLTLFNLICLIYCYVIDGVMKKHGMESDNE